MWVWRIPSSVTTPMDVIVPLQVGDSKNPNSHMLKSWGASYLQCLEPGICCWNVAKFSTSTPKLVHYKMQLSIMSQAQTNWTIEAAVLFQRRLGLPFESICWCKVCVRDLHDWKSRNGCLVTVNGGLTWLNHK